jgi:hypothetical protein
MVSLLWVTEDGGHLRTPADVMYGVYELSDPCAYSIIPNVEIHALPPWVFRCGGLTSQCYSYKCGILDQRLPHTFAAIVANRYTCPPGS